jgi:aminoglycoside phosphotransferase (APT) family kinase protein
MITSFEIMADKEEDKNSNKTINRRIDGYAYALARLHSLNVTKLNLKGLNPPKDSYAFAKSWPRSLKYYLQLETRHPDEILQLYRKGIDWLEANSSNNICSCFSILQGDTHPSNSMFNSDNRFILFDFECSQIGDPAYDIARMCHLIKFIVSPHNPELAKGKADRFLARYQKAIGKDVSARLKFYSVASLIELSIPYSTSISNPMRANHYLRRRFLPSIPFLRLPIIFLAFPFLRVSFVNKKIGMEGNILWLKYAKRYLEISLN